MQDTKRKGMSRILSACLALAVCTASLPAAAADTGGKNAAPGRSSAPTLTVDMAQGGRPLKHGAAGWLYGLGADGVPSANTVTPLKPHTAVQKAPNGMQHPDGDVLDVAKSYLNAGGKNLQIYVPDYYALWFYEFTGKEPYLKILEMQAQECIKAGIQDDVVYVLYNEPTPNWVTEDNNWDDEFEFWGEMVEKLRQVYKDAGITTQPKTAGLNLAVYNNGTMDAYIKYCVEHNCMPDVISWHDLSTWQFNNFDSEYNHYRSLETKYLTQENKEKYGVDITPREIVINEYADRYECASPGDLVRWIGLWEAYSVNGCLPFWHLSNDLNGLAAENNEGNGAWWLYKWYGDMSGSYLPVQVSNTEKSDFYGVASLDENKKSGNVVFGGVDGSSSIVLDKVTGTQTFKGAAKVHVKLEASDYTGFHGPAQEPRTVLEGAVPVQADGSVSIPVSNMNSMTAYNITLTQASEDEPETLLSSTWKEKYEAEQAQLSGNAKVADAHPHYAESGRKRVDFVDTAADKVTFTVEVPKDGYYRYDMVYGAATGCNTENPAQNTPFTATQTLTVDEEKPLEMALPTTLNWSMGGMYGTSIYLDAGQHKLTVAGTDSKGKAVLDCIYLMYQGAGEIDTQFDHTYQAELGEFNEGKDGKTTLTTVKEGSTGYITGLEGRAVPDGGGVRFTAVVPDNGLYTLDLRYRAPAATQARVYLDNDMKNLDNLRATVSLPKTDDAWGDVYQTVFLQKGINILDIDAAAAVDLDFVNIKAAAKSAPVATVEAESGALTNASVGENADVKPHASANGYVSGIPAANDVELIPQDDPDFTILGLGRVADKGEAVDQNNLKITVDAPAAGSYKMVVYQSNGELFGKHSYNAQMTERWANFKVNGGEPQKVTFRNTYSDEVFRPQVVDVALQKGQNTITIYNDNSKVITNGILKPGQSAHRPENIDYNVLENYTPNFDKFEFYAATAATDVPQATYYTVKTGTTPGGMVAASQTKVQAGGTVYLTFTPDKGATLVQATVNGQDVMGQLSSAGGVVTVDNVSRDLDVRAVYATYTPVEQPRVDPTLYYFVDCGDINPATLNAEEFYGSLNKGQTDQFYTEESGWGVVDTYKKSDKYPNLLTGEKTWPCENDGQVDGSVKEWSFRYAKDQARGDGGVAYRFTLPKKAATYPVEIGFYVPGQWTSASNPRTMKVSFNDTVIEEGFTASNDYKKPAVLTENATVGQDGLLTIRADFADNAVWGPVVSYIKLFNPDGQIDTSVLQALYDANKAKTEADYTAESWKAFQRALDAAKGILDAPAGKHQKDANDAATALQQAAIELVVSADKAALQDLYRRGKALKQEDYPAEKWAAFQKQMTVAAFVLQKQNATQAEVDAAKAALQAATDGLTEKADKTALETLYNANKDKKQESYTDESWKAFAAALDAAKAVLDSDAPTADVVHATEASLQAALDALTEKPAAPAVNKEALQKLYSDNQEKVQADYTDASWKVLITARDAAKTVLDSTAADQKVVDAVRAAFQAAIDGLTKEAAQPEKPEMQTVVTLANGEKKTVTHAEDIVEIPQSSTFTVELASSQKLDEFRYNPGTEKIISTGTVTPWDGTKGTYTIYGLGDPNGQQTTTGVYVNGKKLFNAKVVKRPLTSDTTMDMTLRVGKTYTFWVDPDDANAAFTFQTANGKALSTSVVAKQYPDPKTGRYYCKVTAKEAGKSVGVYCTVGNSTYKLFTVSCVR